ncbi:MAG: DUF2752 domain-containing protein [Limisphaerales bacterium]
MKAVEEIPPPLPAAETGRTESLRWLLVVAGGAVAARGAMFFGLPLPGCLLREMTGVPCPFCGSTRAFGALASLDFAQALRWNPLVSAGACVMFVLLLVALARGRGGAGLPERVGSAFASAPRRWLLAAALALNWLYLFLHLPR